MTEPTPRVEVSPESIEQDKEREAASAYLRNLQFNQLESTNWNVGNGQFVEGGRFQLPYNQPEERAFAEAVYKLIQSKLTDYNPNSNIRNTRGTEALVSVGGLRTFTGGWNERAHFALTEDFFKKLQQGLSEARAR